jgi:hypothetical protein
MFTRGGVSRFLVVMNWEANLPSAIALRNGDLRLPWTNQSKGVEINFDGTLGRDRKQVLVKGGWIGEKQIIRVDRT